MNSKIFKILECVFTIIAIIALIIGIAFFSYTIYYTMQESNLGTGISIALGLIFYVIFGGISIVSSIIGIIITLIERKKVKTKTNKRLLISNSIIGIFSLLLFLILLVVV